jgi:type II secretory pathway component PulK
MTTQSHTTQNTLATPATKAEPSPKEFLEKADAKVEELSAAIASASGEARVQARLGLMELADSWKEAQSGLGKQIGRMKQAAAKAMTAVDTAKVRTHLAKVDAADAVEDMRVRLQRIEQRLETLVARGEEQTRDALDRLSKSCHELSKKLRDA